MRIKALEDFSIDGERFVAGDVRTVDTRIAQIAVGAGWAEDADGKMSKGERKPGATADIKMAPVSHVG